MGRKGNTVTLAHLPPGYRPGHPGAGRVVLRSDSAGATHELAQACADRGVQFSFGFPVTARIQDIVALIPESCWDDALATGPEEFRGGAWVASGDRHGQPEGLATGMPADPA